MESMRIPDTMIELACAVYSNNIPRKDAMAELRSLKGFNAVTFPKCYEDMILSKGFPYV